MNFLCDRCKQKYHVADEKVRGRAVTRFKCKKCENIIELRLAPGGDGNSLPPEDLTGAREVPASIPPPAPAPRPATGPRAAPSVPPAAAAPRPAGAGLPTAGSALRAPTNAPLPSRPATGVGLSTAAATAASRPAAAPLPSAPRPAAPRPATGTGLPNAARAMAPAPAPRPATGTGLPVAAPKPPPAATSPLRSSLGKTDGPARAPSSASALLNASETGWYAGVRDLPVGPLTRTELAVKIAAGDITPDSLVWREGLDDWRPLRSVAELSDLVRHAAQRMSDDLLGTMGRREAPPASGGKVVPIAQARAGARGFEADDVGDDEPTRMTSLADLVAKAEEAERPSDPGERSSGPIPSTARSAPFAAPAPKPAPAARPAAPAPKPAPPAAQPSPPARARQQPAPPPPAAAPPPPAAMPAVAPVVAAAVPAANAGMTPFAPTPAVAPAPMFAAPAAAGKPSPAALAGPNDPTVNVDPSATPFTMGGPLAIATSAPVVAEPTGSRRRGGVPVGMWVLMAGVGVFGIAIGIFLRPSGNSGSVPAQTAARSTPPPATDPPITRSVAAEIHLPADPPPTPPAAPAAPATPPPAPAASTPAMASTAEAHHAASHANTVATAPAPPHALNAAQLAAINALGAQTAGVAQSSGPTTTQLRNTPQPTDSAGGGLTGQARAGQVIEALRRSNVVDSCWTAAQRRNPAHPGEQIRVQLDVLPTGRAARVSVSGSTDPDLSSCIQNRARANPYGSGGQITAEVSFSLVSGQ